MIENQQYVNAAVRLWEKPREQENSLLVQRSGFDGPAYGLETVDRVEGGAWVLSWVFVSDDEVEDG